LVKVHSMNNPNQDNSKPLIAQQAMRLRDLVAQIQRCCQKRQMLETDLFGLPQAELSLLMQYGDQRYLTPKVLSSSLEVSKSRVSKLLESLKEKGYIQQVADPGDKRVKLLCLTETGRVKAAEIDGFIQELFSKVITELDPAQRSTVLASLELLWSAMESAKSDCMAR
jgi:DNA-binding MarR family transcriptional regulator